MITMGMSREFSRALLKISSSLKGCISFLCNVSWLRSLVFGLGVSILQKGPVPQHIAIIMDGNRRFAKKQNLPKQEGHSKGADKISEVVEWMQLIGVKELTLYCFSIENFKRSREEVDYLFDLCAKIVTRETTDRYELSVRVLGNMDLFPPGLQRLLSDTVLYARSQNYNKMTLNLCAAYTARDDMCTVMRHLADGVREGAIYTSDITEDLFKKCLYTGKCRDLDLLLRTSGEVRLSDFLLWESSFSHLQFVNVTWPEFGQWQCLKMLLRYQRELPPIQEARRTASKRNRTSSYLYNSSRDVKLDEFLSTHAPEGFAMKRDKNSDTRVETFLCNLEEKQVTELKRKAKWLLVEDMQ